LVVVVARNRQPSASPGSAPAPAEPKTDQAEQHPAEIDPRPAARQRLDDWLRQESAPWIERDLRPDVLRLYDSRVQPGTAFAVRLGPELVRSGKATILVGRHTEVIVLYPAPAAAVVSGGMIFETTARQHHTFQPSPPVALSSPVIDGGDVLDRSRVIRGRARSRTTASCGEAWHSG
jgi:hypothetical protein